VSIPLVIIAGPTASGKSALGLALARELGGEILSIDSVQVYRGADIGSAKPTPAEQALVPHHLIDVVSPDEQFNVHDFVTRAEAAIADMAARGRVCVVIGGTTLYLTALLHGLAELPPGDAELRAELEDERSEDLHARLAALDPTSAARLHVNDRIRVIRAIESTLHGGRPAALAHGEHRFADVRYPAAIFVLARERLDLYERINRRAAEMVERGLLTETGDLIAQYGERLPVLRTLGYAQAAAVLRGELDIADLPESIAQATRRFAKRQVTYWRNEPTKRGWRTVPGSADPAVVLPQDPPTGRRGRHGAELRAVALSPASIVGEARGWLQSSPRGVQVTTISAAALESDDFDAPSRPTR